MTNVIRKTRKPAAVAVAVATIDDADALFRTAAEAWRKASGIQSEKAWESAKALATVFSVAAKAGTDFTTAWKHVVGLCEAAGITGQRRSEWIRSGAGMAQGLTPAANETMEKFAQRCPSDPRRKGGTGSRGAEVRTAAQRAKKLRSAEKDVAEANSKLITCGASKQVQQAAAALIKMIDAAASAEEAAAEAEKAAK